MYLKRTSPFNEKPVRGSRKKKSSDKSDQHKRIIKITLDKDGNVYSILTKSGTEVKLEDYNKFDLLKIRDIFVERGNIDTPVYQGILAEIERRITLGEITPTDTAPEKGPAA